MFKFCSMHTNAEARLAQLRAQSLDVVLDVQAGLVISASPG